MSKLVGQSAHFLKRVVVIEHEEWVSAVGAERESTASLADVGVDVYPPLFVEAALQDAGVLIAEGGHARANHLHGLAIGKVSLIADDRHVYVVAVQAVDAKSAPLDLPEAVPHGQLAFEGIEQVVVYLDRNVVLGQRRFK